MSETKRRPSGSRAVEVPPAGKNLKPRPAGGWSTSSVACWSLRLDVAVLDVAGPGVVHVGAQLEVDGEPVSVESPRPRSWAHPRHRPRR